MKNTWQNPIPKYNLPLILSVAVHIAILLLLVINAPVTSYRMTPSAANQKPVIHAVAVDLAAVNAQVQNIQARDAALKAQEQERVRQLQDQADAARQASAVEAQRLAQLKIDQQRVQQQRVEVARQAQLEQQRLVQLKAQQQAQVQAMQVKALAIKKQQQEAQAKAQALKNQQQLAAKQNALQQQLMQQQIANEQKQLLHDQQMRQMQGVVDQYRAKILMAIANQWLIPDDVDPSLACVFTIDLTPSGVVSRAQLVRSSGNAALDRAAQAAIYKASPLPVPKDPTAFNTFRHFTLKMTPQDIMK